MLCRWSREFLLAHSRWEIVDVSECNNQRWCVLVFILDLCTPWIMYTVVLCFAWLLLWHEFIINPDDLFIYPYWLWGAWLVMEQTWMKCETLIIGHLGCALYVICYITWRRYHVETLSASEAICEGNPPKIDKWPVIRSFGCSFLVTWNRLLHKQCRCRSFQTPWR